MAATRLTRREHPFSSRSSVRAKRLFAVQGQVALSSHRWPVGIEVKVRMGIHAGQVRASARGPASVRLASVFGRRDKGPWQSPEHLRTRATGENFHVAATRRN